MDMACREVQLPMEHSVRHLSSYLPICLFVLPPCPAQDKGGKARQYVIIETLAAHSSSVLPRGLDDVL